MSVCFASEPLAGTIRGGRRYWEWSALAVTVAGFERCEVEGR